MAAKNARALCNAAIEGKADVVRQLLAKGADPNGSTQHWTALSCAVLSGQIELVGALLDAGADPNAPDPEDGTLPLMHVAVLEMQALTSFGSARKPASKPADILRLLVSRGANPSARDRRIADSCPFTASCDEGGREAALSVSVRSVQIIRCSGASRRLDLSSRCRSRRRSGSSP